LGPQKRGFHKSTVGGAPIGAHRCLTEHYGFPRERRKLRNPFLGFGPKSTGGSTWGQHIFKPPSYLKGGGPNRGFRERVGLFWGGPKLSPSRWCGHNTIENRGGIL